MPLPRLLFSDIEAAADEVILAEEILDGRVGEVSGVDQPATAREFTAFKGMGFDKPPVSGYTACLARDDMPTPTSCEGGTDEDHNLRRALEPDYAGHNFAHDYAHAKATPEGADPEAFDQCVQDIVAKIEDGTVVPDDPDADPKSVGFAMCTASGAGMGKDITMSVTTGTPPVPELGAAIDMPSIGDKVDGDDLVAIGTSLGLTPEQAAETSKAVLTDWGAVWDPTLALVPTGTTAEQLVAGAAKSLGYRDTGPSMALKGKSHWLDKVKAIFGENDRKPGAQVLAKELRYLQKTVEGVMQAQEKSSADLRYAFDALLQAQAADRRLMARAMGIDPAVIDEDEAEPKPAAAPALAAPGKAVGQKDEPPPPDAAQGGDPMEARMSAVESAVNQIVPAVNRILEALGAGGGSAPATEPAKRVSTPPEPIAARRFGAKATQGAGGPTVPSTLFGGMPISRADREAAIESMGVGRYVRQ